MIRIVSVLFTLALVILVPLGATAQAASLSVSPIRLNVVAPGKQTQLTVRNESAGPVTIQVRVFAWTLRNGSDHYLQTRDVIVSPPIARVRGRGELHVRILRVTRAPVTGEQNFRVIVDEVPDANRVRNIGVNVALRYALPLFFLNPSAKQPRLQWSVRRRGKRRVLVATNSGKKHVRLANLSFGNMKLFRGLAGYVLGRSTRDFVLPARAPQRGRVTAITGEGRLNAKVNQ